MSVVVRALLRSPWLPVLYFWLLLSICGLAEAQSQYPGWIQIQDNEGNTEWVKDDRKPALYTGDFGDCQGDSVINVTRFDGALYKDNMTVLFHLAGNTALVNESIMMYLGVYAYGEARFNLTFNPCNANINSMCPLNSSVEIDATAVIPISDGDLSLVPDIALVIPDFEGMAILRIFSNSTESQIACYSAVLTNGATFSHPAAVSSVLGAFSAIAIIFSVLVTIHGGSVFETRKHHAHSVSVFMVFAVYHHIFFTGALSMNWPSVLVAFWSNYAWSAGMIHTGAMQSSINKFIGKNQGNISMVGAAAAGTDSSSLGGGVSIAQIYKRAASNIKFEPYEGIGLDLRTRAIEQLLSKRDALANKTTGYLWYGNPVTPGLPLPGNYSGFAGTLAQENIAISDAFLTGLIWFLVLVGGVALSMALLKWTVELMYQCRLLKTERLAYFRRHWLVFMAAAVLRTMFIGFFMFMILTLFQFDFGGAAGVMAIAAVVFSLFMVVMFGLLGLAAYSQWRAGRLIVGSDRLHFEYKNGLGFIPWVTMVRASTLGEKDEERKLFGSIPWYGFRSAERKDDQYIAHGDDKFIVRFGWLVARYRDSRWWFPGVWLLYELVRACFYGGAANHPLVQVFGLLAVECIAFFYTVSVRPFEATRLNLMLVYLLGISKILTVALSSAFEVRFDQDRIICTVIGIVIIVIQGVLTICLMIAIVVGVISSYMSLTRNHENFHPRRWRGIRRKYLRHVDFAAKDRPAPPPPPPPPPPPVPTEPYFKVGSVRRQPKIEDEDGESTTNRNDSLSSLNYGHDQAVTPTRAPSRTQSIRSVGSQSNLPFGARPHRTSWSTRDFEDWRSSSGTPRPLRSENSIPASLNRQRAATMRSPAPPNFDITPTRQARSSSLRGPGPSRISFDSPRNGTPEVHGSRHQRSSSGALQLQATNISEEREADLKENQL